MRLIFLGPPGAGKGTPSQSLVDYLTVLRSSTGKMLRQALELQTEAGRAGEEYMSRGRLVPDPIILRLVGARPAQPDTRLGYLFDCFTRNLTQAKALDVFLAARRIPLSGVLDLKVGRDELLRRLVGRRRADDRPEVIRERLDGYLEQTAPLEEFYRQWGLLHEVDGRGTQHEVFARIRGVVDKLDRPADEKRNSD